MQAAQDLTQVQAQQLLIYQERLMQLQKTEQLSYQAGGCFVALTTPTKNVFKYFSNSFWPLNEWVQFTWVSNGSTFSFYKNGVSIESGNIAGTTSQTDAQSTLGIGRPNNSSCCEFDGKVGGVLVYNAALTATEVLQNYNAQKNRFI